MKKFFFSVLISTICVTLHAQNSIKVNVIDSISKEPISGATIFLKNGDSIVADNDGQFQLKLNGEQTIDITINAIGYFRKQILVPKQKIFTATINRTRTLMMPIEIKSVRAGENFPFTQSLISKKRLDGKNLGQDIPFLLNQVPGTVINSDAGNGIGYTGIRIRGTDATRINITLNGIPYNDAESQGVFFVNLPDLISSTSSIQVQRGVGTSSNGTGAFGATINFLTNEPQLNPYGTISNSIGSFNSIKNTIKAGTGLINNQYTFDMRLSSIKSDGYVDRASSNLKSFYISAASLKEKSSLRLNIFSGKEKTYQSWYGITEEQLNSNRKYNSAGTEKNSAPYDNETDNYTQTHFQLFYNKKINQNWNFNNASFLTKGAGFYEQYKASQEFVNYGLNNPVINDIEIQTTDLIRQLWLDNTFWGNNFSFQYKNEKKEIIIGGGASKYEGNHFGKIIWANYAIAKDYRWYDLDAHKSEQHLFVKWLQKIKKGISVFGDLQIRNVAYKINGFRDNPSLIIDKNWLFVNPKMGVKKTLGNYSAYLSYAMANKEPNRDDFESGKTEMPKSEILHDFEAGVEKKSAKSKLAANVFYMQYKDQLVLTGKINDVGAYTRTNIPNSFRAGIEIVSELTFTDWLKMSNNISLSENKIKNFTEYYDNYDLGIQNTNQYKKVDIAYSPALIGASSISSKVCKGLETSLISKYVGRQYLDNTSRKDRSLDSYFIQDLQINYQIQLKNIKSLELILQINNIWNRKYEPNGYTYTYVYGGEMSRNNYYFPMAGTNFQIGLNLNF